MSGKFLLLNWMLGLVTVATVLPWIERVFFGGG